jgi:MFS family permease
MSVFAVTPLIGAAVGPISGGYIAQNIGVKSIFFIMSGICGAAALISIPFLKETYAPLIRLRLATKLSGSEKTIRTLLPENESIWLLLRVNFSRPIILISHSFIFFILCLYLAM